MNPNLLSGLIVTEMDQDSLSQALGGLCPAVNYLEETDSTNRVAMEWAAAGAPEGAIVVADYQSAGKGRLDRTWFAPPGECLLFSLVLRLDCRPEQAPLINLAAAVALSRAIEPEGLRATVKWPNDVLLHGRKTAGILTQAAWPGTQPPEKPGSLVVLGVGVNVNVRQFPPELASSATSLFLELRRPVARTRLLRRFLEHLGELTRRFPEGVVEAYLPLSDVLGRNVRVQLPEGFIEGKVQTIDALGNLVFETGEKVSVGDLEYPPAEDLPNGGSSTRGP